MLDTGDKYEGLPSERDIDKHRTARKKLSPAFSNRALKQYEPIVKENLARFIQTLEECGQGDDGVNITEVQILEGTPTLPYRLIFDY